MKRYWLITLIILIFGFFVLKVSASNYNRTAAVGYADHYCSDANPAYYCPDWNDCMNFSSQVLHAGGLPEIGWWEWDVNHWFFNGCDWLQHSNTWSVPAWFDNHAEQTPSRYQQLSVYSLSPGDVILFDWPGQVSDWEHSAIYMCNYQRSQHNPNQCRVGMFDGVPNNT